MKPSGHEETIQAPSGHAQTQQDDEDPPVASTPVVSVAPQGSDPRRYHVLRELARGGLGRILEADDRILQRTVAIKELRVSARGRARFMREAMVTARLQHPSIVPLYDVGRWESGEPYYSMKLVSGEPFDVVIGKTKTLDERLALLPHVIAIADAMAYAHSQRIIHRDLKPANVIIGKFGETVVIDWGLAKDLEDTSTQVDDPDEPDPYRASGGDIALTAAGEVLGTPVYMAPEQAKAKPLDERADVYAIGAILYESLTGAWPHRGNTTAQVIARLIAGEPFTPIEQQQPDVPPELTTIVNKAMAHEPEGRYRTAHELAADLRRFQTGQLVASHRYTRGMLFRRWVRRHRAAVGVAAALTVVLAVVVAVGLHRILAERDATRAERDRLILANARGLLERDPTSALQALRQYPSNGAELDKAREIALDAHARGVATYVVQHDARLPGGRFSPDGKLYAQRAGDGVEIVDLQAGRRSTLPFVRRVGWRDTSSMIAKLDDSRWAIVDIASGRMAPLYGALGNVELNSVDVEIVDPDGSVVLPDEQNHLVRYTKTGGSPSPLPVPFVVEHYVRHAGRVATRNPSGDIVWWAPSEREAHVLSRPPNVTFGGEDTYRFSDDGTKLVAGTTTGQLAVWNLADGAVQVLDGNGARVNSLLGSRQTDEVVTITADSTVRLWDLRKGTSRTLPAIGTIRDIALSRDGRWVAAGLQDHRIVLFDTRTGDHHAIGMHASPVATVSFSSDGRWLATRSDEPETRLWKLPETPLAVFAAHENRVQSVATSPDGTIASVAGKMLAFWNGESRRELEAHTNDIWYVQRAGSSFVTASQDGLIRIWDVGKGTSRALDDGGGPVMSIAPSSDGNRLASTHLRGDVRSWDLATGSSRLLATIPRAGFCQISPDGKTVVVGEPGGVRLLPVDGSAGRRLAVDSDHIWVARMSPDGRRVAVGGAQGAVVVFEVATGEAHKLASRRGTVYELAFSPDGRQLAATSTEGDAGLWDLDTYRGRTLVGYAGEVTTITFLADGTLVSGGTDGTLRVWEQGSLRSMTRVQGEVSAVSSYAEGLVVGTSAGLVYRLPARTFTATTLSLAALLDRVTRF